MAVEPIISEEWGFYTDEVIELPTFDDRYF